MDRRAALLLLLLTAGCNGGSVSRPSASTASTATAPVTSATGTAPISSSATPSVPVPAPTPPPIASTTLTLATGPKAPAASTVAPGAARVVAAQARLTATNVVISGVTLRSSGTSIPSRDVDRVELVLDADSDGAFDPAKDVLLASGTYVNGAAVFASPAFAPQTLRGSVDVLALVTLSQTATAGATLSVTLDGADVAATDGATGAPVPATGREAGAPITVAAPAPTPASIARIVVSPSSTSIATGGTAQFAAQALDTSGNVVAASITWAATGGTITTGGLYTAGTNGGTFDVSASSGSIVGHASVVVTAPPPPPPTGPGTAVPPTDVTVAPYAPVIPTIAWNSYLVAQSNKSLLMKSGDTVTIWFEWLNTGGSTWHHAGMSRIGTSMPNDRPSVFANASWLYSNNRPTTVDADTPSGARGRYTFTITAPQVAQRTAFREFFCQVEDGVQWLQFPAMIDIVVDPASGASTAPAASNTWRLRAPMPTPRSGLCAVTTDSGRILCIGGTYVNNPRDLCEEYDPTSDSWRMRAPMPTRRAHAGAAYLNGKVYVVGGYYDNGAQRLKSVECYDVASDTWAVLPDLPMDRSYPIVVAYQGKIWSIGGWETIPNTPNGVWRTYAYIYDPATSAWTTGPDLGFALIPESKAVVANGQIQIFGSANASGNLTSQILYGPFGSSFNQVVTFSQPTPTAAPASLAPNQFGPGCGVATNGTKVFAVGGRIWSTIYGEARSIDAASVAGGALQTLAPMSVTREDPGVAASAGKVYVFGGDDPNAFGPRPWVEEYAP